MSRSNDTKRTLRERVAAAKEVALPPVSRRPILDIGIALAALVIVSLIVLVTTRSIGILGPDPNADPTLGTSTGFGLAPWPQIAAVVLAFTLPAVVCAVFVILRDVELSRGVRYACFSLACVYAAAVATIAVLAAAGPDDAPSTSANLVRMVKLASWWGLLITGAFGALLGLSLPAVHKHAEPVEGVPGERAPGEHASGEHVPAERAPAERALGEHVPAERTPAERAPGESLSVQPRHSRRRVTFYVLCGLIVAIVVYTVCAAGWFGSTATSTATNATNAASTATTATTAATNATTNATNATDATGTATSGVSIAEGLAAPGAWVSFTRDFIAMPAMAILAATLAVAIAGRFIEVPAFHASARHVMIALPLMAWSAYSIVALASGSAALPGGLPWVALCVVAFAGLGTLPGLVIAGMRD